MGAMDASAQRKPALGFIFITLVLLVLGFGIIIPILPRLIVQFRGGSFAAGSSSYGLLVSVFAVMQFIASPILGSLSDRFGRRKPGRWPGLPSGRQTCGAPYGGWRGQRPCPASSRRRPARRSGRASVPSCPRTRG